MPSHLLPLPSLVPHSLHLVLMPSHLLPIPSLVPHSLHLVLMPSHLLPLPSGSRQKPFENRCLTIPNNLLNNRAGNRTADPSIEGRLQLSDGSRSSFDRRVDSPFIDPRELP
ncbi:hypothetical protein EYF80_056333 [Liparis tanakae]|uniref:Uncharacterized protein n=1 Tax=Liparis tanakae TaxID=230148 RepID=A0A4Z2EYR3_9TELE|nr:hypothetical protein EYF80_056333 [Liparis tanakae]